MAVTLCRKNKDIYFLLCGKGVDEQLRTRVREEGLIDQIKLLGHRKDIIKVLNTLDCFYFPSINEGQPNALIEAMIAGLPIIASDIAPIKETVPEESHDLLVSPLNSTLHIKRILEFKEYTFERLILKDWAIKNFSAKKWFTQFYSKI